MGIANATSYLAIALYNGSVEIDATPPQINADISDPSGTTGDLYSFDISASDNIGVASVNVSWDHDLLGGNLALSDDGDGTWSGSVVLDDSVSESSKTEEPK